jgi:ABC-2 type transport system permease protein
MATMTNLSATNFAILPPPDMPIGRVVRAYLSEAGCELRHHLRTPAMSLPFLALPSLLYLFFGVLLAGASPEVRGNPNLAAYIFSGWCAYAAMGPALFGIGCGLAAERDAGLLKLKRALPAPTGSYLSAKLLMSMVFAAIAVGSVIAMALALGSVALTAGPLVRMAIVMVVGAVPFAAIGFFIGAYASGSAAPAFANLVFLPMLWLSGLFFPLPKILEPWVVIWPAFHLNQVALAAAGVEGFRFLDPGIAVAVLIGATVLFGGLSARRLARVG